jgi:hypothetical protein
MHIDVVQLEDRIKELKNNLIYTAKKTGLNSPDTIACSQELDQLIILAIKSREILIPYQVH